MIDIAPVQADFRALDKAVKDLRKHTGRSAVQAVKFASIMLAKSGRAASKPGKTRHEVIDNPDRTTVRVRKGKRGRRRTGDTSGRIKKVGAKYAIVKLTQGGGQKLIPVNRKSDPRRKIKMRGLAQSSWGFMLIKLGVASGRKTQRRAKGVISVTKKLKGANPEVRLSNDLGYITKAYPGIEATVMRKATKALQIRIEQRMKPKLKQWR